MELERLIKQEKQAVKEGKARFPPIRRWDEIRQLASYCHINDDDELHRCINLLHGSHCCLSYSIVRARLLID